MLSRTAARTAWVAPLILTCCREPTKAVSAVSHVDAVGKPVAAVSYAPPARLKPDQAIDLESWWAAVGKRREGETFGELVVRTARHQLQRPYDNHRQNSADEVLHIDLTRFQCVSLVESSLAVARCVWRGQSNQECYVTDLEASRYRGGRLDGYASRLHYFPDWLLDNENRGRVRITTGALGGRRIRHRFSFMTSHVGLYPPLQNRSVFAAIRAQEQRLSETDWVVLERDQVTTAESGMQNGDIVALVSAKKPGLLIGHAGFVDKSATGVPRLLHASSHHKRVLLTTAGVAEYVRRRTYRRGIMVARPLSPP